MGFQVLKAKIGVVSATKSTFGAIIANFGISGPSSIFRDLRFARQCTGSVMSCVSHRGPIARRANRLGQVLRLEQDFSMMLSGFHNAVRLGRLAQRKNRVGYAAKRPAGKDRPYLFAKVLGDLGLETVRA